MRDVREGSELYRRRVHERELQGELGLRHEPTVLRQYLLLAVRQQQLRRLRHQLHLGEKSRDLLQRPRHADLQSRLLRRPDS